MKRLALFLACLPAFGQLNLVNPTTSGIYAVSSYNSATPVQLTMASAPSGWTVGTKIWCVGMLGLPAARNKVVEVKTISGNLVTLRTTTGADIPGSAGGTFDISAVDPGTQAGHCAAVQSTTLAPHPRGRIPQVGTAEYTRMMLLPSTDSTWWNSNFIASMNTKSTPSGCDGVTAALCPVEEAQVLNHDDGLQLGFDPLNLALAWKITGVDRYKYAAIYLLNAVARWDMPARKSNGFNVSTGLNASYAFADWDVAADYSAWGTYMLMEAYSLMRSEMTSGQRTTLLNKYWNDKTTGCTNMQAAQGGWITCAGSECTVNDASSLPVNTLLFINAQVRQYTLANGDFTSIVSTGTAVTITLSATAQANPPRGTSYEITGAAESTLNAVFPGSYSATTGAVTITTTAVPAGTYTDAGLGLVAHGLNGNSGNGAYARVTAVNTAATPDEITLNWNGTALTQVYRGLYAIARETWQTGDCGYNWFHMHHDTHDFYPSARVAFSQATIPAGAKTIQLTAATWPEYADMTPPFTIRANSEQITVTAMNAGTRTLTVTRGVNFTAASQITTGTPLTYNAEVGHVTNTVDGVDGMLIGRWTENKTASTIQPMAIAALAAADDDARAAAWAEYWWNLYVLAHWRNHRAVFAGPLYAGLVNTGYFFGRWGTYLTALQVAGLNAFTPAIDLRFTGSQRMFEFVMRAMLPESPTSLMTYGDDGTQRAIERDDTQGALWPASQLYANDQGMRAVMDFWAKNWAWAGTDDQQAESWPARIFSYDPARPVVDYTTLQRSAVFVDTDAALPGDYKSTAVMHRSGWDSGNTYAAMGLLGGDHHGGYTGTGQLFVTRNEAHLIDGVGPAGSGGTDIRYQNVSINWGVPTLTVLTGNSTVSSTWTARLAAAAGTGGALIGVESNNRYVAYPRYFTVPEGSITTTVPLLLYQTPTAQTATLTVASANTITAYTRGGATSGALTPGTATVASVALTGPLTAGHYLQGTITLASAAPSGGVDVTVTSNNAQVIPTPSTVRVRAGVTTAAFFVAASAAATGTATITATSASAATAAVSITAASPGTGTLVFFAADTNTTTGMIQNSTTASTFWGRTTPRSTAWNDGAYARFNNTASYLSTANVGHHYRDAVLLDDFAITYDKWLHTLPGHLKVNMYQHVCVNNQDGNVNQSPACSWSQSGSRVTLVSNEYGEQISSTTILPSSANVIRVEPWTRGSVNAGNRIWVYGSQATDEDFLAVHQPQSAGDTPATWTLLSSDSGSRVIQSAGASPWIVAFSNNVNGASSMTFQAGSFAGTGNIIFTGLQANQLYSVLRDGTPLATDQTVGPDGTLRISATYGSGAFAVTGTGALPLSILTSSLPGGAVGTAYSASLTAAGGTAPYTWDVVSGGLPDGLSLAGAAISGTPTTEGAFAFTVRATDAAAAQDTRAMSITIAAAAPPVDITTDSLPSVQLGQAYSATLAATGGVGGVLWAITSGSLPVGLALAPSGTISGTPTVPGSYVFTVSATDGVTTDTAVLSISVQSLTDPEIASVEWGNSAAIVRIRSLGMQVDTPCVVAILQGGQESASVDSPAGLGAREVILTGLLPATEYTVTAHCGGAAVQRSGATTALNGTASLALRYPVVRGADGITVEHGPTSALGASASGTCTATSCTVTLGDLPRGAIYWTRHTWTLGGVAIAVGDVTAAVVR